MDDCGYAQLGIECTRRCFDNMFENFQTKIRMLKELIHFLTI